MGIVSGIVVYFMIFWTALFCILPWGNKPHEEHGQGLAGSAPHNPRLKQKFIITALVSALIWVIVYILIELDIVDWRMIAEHMAEEDHLS